MAILAEKNQLREEVANTLTHSFGLLLSIAGLVLLVVFSLLRGTTLHVVSCSVFGVTLVLLYFFSSLYHAVSHERIKNHFLRRADHICIYFLIAGTYTPFALVTLKGPWGWSLFGVVWGLALIGTIFKLIFAYRYNYLSTAAYLLMGWCVIFALKPLITNLALGGLIWLFLGGFFYSAGCFFYLKDEKYSYFHAYWHLMVLMGSLCHFFSIFFYVIP